MEIVKFNNGEHAGKYALRRWVIIYWYRDLWYYYDYKWYGIRSKWFHRCVTDNIKELKRYLNPKPPKPPEPIDYGTPIDTDEESFWNKIKNNKKKPTKLQDKVSTKLTELDEAIEERE